MSKPLAIGVMGQAPMSKKACIAAFTDHVGEREIRLIFAVTARGEHDELPPVVKYLVEYAIANEIPYETVTDETSASIDGFEAIQGSAAAKSRNVQRVGHRITNILGDLREQDWDVEFLIAWGGNEIGSDEDYAAIERCWAPGIHGGSERAPIPALDITDAFESLDEAPGDPTAPVDPNIEPEPAAEPIVDEGEDEIVPEDEPVEENEPELLPVTSEEFDPAKSTEELPTNLKAAHKAGVRFWRARMRECSTYPSRSVGQLSLEQILELVYEPGTPNIDAAQLDAGYAELAKDPERPSERIQGKVGIVEVEVDPENLRPPLPASVPIPPVVLEVPLGYAPPETQSEDTIVGRSRAEMEQYAKDRADLLAGKKPKGGQVLVILDLDLRELVLESHTSARDVVYLLGEKVLDALK